MSNFAKSAEKYFALKCSEGGASATPPDEDINGWDFLVEFPIGEHSGPAEDRPSPRTAYVQIKSTVSKRMSTRIKVSNMRIAAQSPDPWFIILVTPGEDEAEKIVRAIHVGHDLIYRSLEATRKLSLNGEDPHKNYLPISFPNDTIVNESIVNWMQGAIGTSAIDYSNQKKEIADKVGYEKSCSVGNVSFSSKSEDEVSRAFLGLNTDLELTQFSLTPSRFGIPDNTPEIDFVSDGAQNGKLTIEPKPVADCMVKIIGPVSETPITLGGKIFVFKFPNAGDESVSTRYSAPPIEIVSVKKGKWDFQLDIKNSEKHSLSHLGISANVRKWMLDETVSYEVWSAGSRTFHGAPTNTSQNQHYQKDNLLQTINALKSALNQNDQICPFVSIEELNSALPNLGFYYRFLGEGSLRISIEQEGRYPNYFDSVIYYVTTTVGTWTFCCLIRRQVIEDTIVDGNRRITCSAPEVLDRCVMENSEEAAIKRISADFERISKSYGEREEVFTMGDIVLFANLAPASN